MKTPSKLEDALFSLSLANLWLLNIWSAVLGASKPSESYFRKSSGKLTLLLSALVAGLLLAACIWGAVAFVRWMNLTILRRFSDSVFLLLLVMPFSTILREILVSIESQSLRYMVVTVVLTLKVALIAAAVAVFLSPSRLVLHLGKAFVLLMAPLALVNIISVGKYRMEVASPVVMPIPKRAETQLMPKRNQGARLVVLIFDEFDQYLMFENRPSSLRLPEIDAFRQQSVFASSAYPAGDDTLVAIPSMTTGRLVREAIPLGPSQLKLTFIDKTSELWGKQANLFSTSAKEGFRIGLVGWHHPYCRIFGAAVRCHWEPVSRVSVQESYFDELGFLKGAVEIFRKLSNLFTVDSYLGIAPSLPTLTGEIDLAKRQQLESYSSILENAVTMLQDPNLDFVFVHWPIPHPFGIYDHERDEFSLSDKVNYLDNLELVDRTLTEVRQAIEVARLVEATTVLITGDHYFRRSEWKQPPWYDEAALINGGVAHRRVPFLLKLRGQKAGTLYDGSFNLVLVHDLILALLREQISTADEFRHWMDLNRSRFPLDFRKGSLGN